ncbi:MAG TPA: SsrA-binding protein SmpB [Patescibacteria group bacterium]|nr:SsrA-binding protein SmpB [Patescibacteria group bacterium]
MKVFAKHRRAFYDYEILETFQAGLVLLGHEVKSIKTGHINIEGSFVTVHKGKLDLLNAHIPAYPFAKISGSYDPYRSRPLLLTKREISGILGKLSQKGLTMIPLKVYEKKRLIKIEIAVSRAHKKEDKREKIKERETKRNIEKALRQPKQ